MIQSIEEIISELVKIQDVPVYDLTKDEDFGFPRQIGVDGERALFINKKIDDLIGRVAHLVYENDRFLRAKINIADVRRIVRSAFGPALVAIDLDDDVVENSIKVRTAVLAAVATDADNMAGQMEHCFSCSLFGFDVSPFQIGPVLFEKRQVWLDRQRSAGIVDETIYRRVSRHWKGGRLVQRRPNLSSMNERDVVDIVGKCPYVASVSTQEISQGLGRERSLLACRIALMAIALLWQTPSKRLDGFNLDFDREPRWQTSVTIARSHLLASRSNVHLTIDGVFRLPDWDEAWREHEDHFRIFGEVISAYLTPPADRDTAHTMMRLFYAILWFHEAARERSSLIATVKFGASMDSLANGRGSDGILKAFEKVLGLKRDARIFSDGTSLKAAIEWIYEQGRSRTIHGSNDQAGRDWSTTSGRAEQLAKRLLLTCAQWALKNPGSNIGALSK